LSQSYWFFLVPPLLLRLRLHSCLQCKHCNNYLLPCCHIDPLIPPPPKKKKLRKIKFLPFSPSSFFFFTILMVEIIKRHLQSKDKKPRVLCRSKLTVLVRKRTHGTPFVHLKSGSYRRNSILGYKCVFHSSLQQLFEIFFAYT
jgi:hypothetical protein